MHGQRPDDPLTYKGGNTPVKGQSGHALHVTNSLGPQIRHVPALKGDAFGPELSMLTILDSFYRRQVGPFEELLG